MNKILVNCMIAAAVAFGIIVIILFNKNSTLNDRLAKLERQFDEATIARTAELAEGKQTIAKLEEALAQNTSADQTREKMLSTEVDTLTQGLTKADNKNMEKLAKADAAIAKVDEDLRKSLALLKTEVAADVAKGVEAALTKQIVAQASETVVKGVLDDKSLLKDEAFLKSVAKSLVDNFRGELRGDSGADANNETIAVLLKKDPEFLDLVSTTVLILGDEKGNEKQD